MAPISEAILEPTLPANIKQTIVGLNSKIILSRAVNPNTYNGNKGLEILKAD